MANAVLRKEQVRIQVQLEVGIRTLPFHVNLVFVGEQAPAASQRFALPTQFHLGIATGGPQCRIVRRRDGKSGSQRRNLLQWSDAKCNRF
ncbi:hypothetical protein, partial [Xanthomonas translucens]|uniref:hypothetical protein n=2 Tax=Xanthomonas campestris pv. translucens TaxID=343 RepID=UPI001E4EA8AE